MTDISWLEIHFQAGYTLRHPVWIEGVPNVVVGTATNFVFKLQAKTDLSSPDPWQEVGVVNGTDLFELIPDGQAAGARARFYQVVVTPAVP